MGKGCEEKKEARHKKMDKVHIKKRRTAQTVKVTASQRGKETPLLGVNRWRAGKKKKTTILAPEKKETAAPPSSAFKEKLAVRGTRYFPL